MLMGQVIPEFEEVIEKLRREVADLKEDNDRLRAPPSADNLERIINAYFDGVSDPSEVELIRAEQIVHHLEGVTKLWRGTNAGLALAIPMVGIYLPFYDVFRVRMEEFATDNAPSVEPYVLFVAGALARSLACTTCYPIELARTRTPAFKEPGKKPPGVLKTLFGVISNVNSTVSHQGKLHSYRVLWTGLGAQLARDVPFSAICWATLEPMRRKLSTITRDESSAVTVLGSNFASGFITGGLAAGATCPLDVARTRRQIEL